MSFLQKILKTKKALSRTSAKKEETKENPSDTAAEKKIPAERKVILGVIRMPHVTEKSNALSSGGAYVFRVADRANKPMVKQAVEARYGVHVVKVSTIMTKGKERRRGRVIGWKPGFKKAMVSVRKGEIIEVQ